MIQRASAKLLGSSAEPRGGHARAAPSTYSLQSEVYMDAIYYSYLQTLRAHGSVEIRFGCSRAAPIIGGHGCGYPEDICEDHLLSTRIICNGRATLWKSRGYIQRRLLLFMVYLIFKYFLRII